VDVTIRSVQDPDTFRDLLYAVVTGQRNHLDSQRKGATVAAGLRRAVVRGTYAGTVLDGYRVAVTVGPRNVVSKRLEIDPDRAPLIETIFSMAQELHPLGDGRETDRGGLEDGQGKTYRRADSVRGVERASRPQ
jgi:hypothetical protein